MSERRDSTVTAPPTEVTLDRGGEERVIARIPVRLPADRTTTAEYPSAEAREVGAVIGGRFRLLALLGTGGMGTVYLAEQTTPVRRRVAVKLIRPGLDSRHVLARFEAERQALALMDHPNITRVLDAGDTPQGRPFVVMELVNGAPITRFCDDRKVPVRGRLELFAAVCRAVQHAHQKGVVHRDLKPSNVLVELHDDRPVPKVIDFGLAKATGLPLTDRTLDTGPGAVVGTPEYMAPEQATLDRPDVDTRADVYALGVLLYELLAGTTPFRPAAAGRDPVLEVLRRVREEDPPTPSTRLGASGALPAVAHARATDAGRLVRLVRGELDWIVMKCLEKDRARRYPTADALAADVQRYLAGEPVSAGPPSVRYRVRKFVGRNRRGLAAAAVLGAVAAAGVAGVGWQAVRATAAEAAARQALAAAERREREARTVAAFMAVPNEARRKNSLAEGVAVIAEAAADLDRAADLSPLARASVENALGYTLIDLYETAGAVRLLERAWRTQVAELPPDHPDTHATQKNLALAYRRVGQADRAVALLEPVVAAEKARLPAGDRGRIINVNNLASIYSSAGHHDKMEPLLRELLVDARARFGTDHHTTAHTLGLLGLALLKQRKYADAEPVLRECLAVRERLVAARDGGVARWQVEHARAKLGAAVAGRGDRPGEAEQLLLAGYAGLKKAERSVPRPSLRIIPDAAGWLADFYRATGRPEKAAEWQAKLPREVGPPPRPAG